MTVSGVTLVTDFADAHWAGEDTPDEIRHPETDELLGTMTYVATDGWRGYHEIVPADGWEKVGEGTNCGAWDDAPAGTSNDEVEAKLRSLAEAHGEVVVVLGGSSNVFSQPYDVLAKKVAS